MIEINWERESRYPPKDIWQSLCTMLSKDMLTLRRRIGNVGSTTITVISGSGGGGGGGGSAVATEYRARAFSSAAGTVVVSFSSAMPSSSYRAIVLIRDGNGRFAVMDEANITKSASGFSFSASEAISGYYIVIEDE